jgi:hypothetical protein
MSNETDAAIVTAFLNYSGDEPDLREIPPEPVAKILEEGRLEHAGVPKALLKTDDAATNAAFAKRFRNLSEPMPYGMNAALKGESVAARIEEKRGADGSLWKYEFDSSGELLRVHQVNADGGRLEKRADGVERDLSKASSGRGNIRFEKTMIPGEDGHPEEWIFQYNHAGENVGAYPADEYERMHSDEVALEI